MIKSLQNKIRRDQGHNSSDISRLASAERNRNLKVSEPAQQTLKTETYHADSIISRSELCHNLAIARSNKRRKFSRALRHLSALIEKATTEPNKEVDEEGSWTIHRSRETLSLRMTPFLSTPLGQSVSRRYKEPETSTICSSKVNNEDLLQIIPKKPKTFWSTQRKSAYKSGLTPSSLSSR